MAIKRLNAMINDLNLYAELHG